MMRAKRMSVATGTLLVAALITIGAQQKAPPKGKADPSKPTAEENYAKICQPCHGPQGKSPLPTMSLADGEWKYGSSTQAIAKTIAEGIPGSAMLPNKDKLSKAEITALARLVRTFDPKLKPEKAPRK
jgi:mono/diheme cytochrome c family protein